MQNKTRLAQAHLMFKILVVALMWGLPSLLAPASVLKIFGVSMPEDPFFMRMFGGVMMRAGVLVLVCLQNPVKNRDIIRYAVIDNSLVFPDHPGRRVDHRHLQSRRCGFRRCWCYSLRSAFWYLMPPK